MNHLGSNLRFFLRHYLEKILASFFVYLLVPSFFIYEIIVVKTTIVKFYEPATAVVIANTLTAFFLFINLVGNMFLAIFIDTRVKRSDAKKVNFCSKCELWQPEKSFHCHVCNVCIMKRDHHCIFLSRCIGLKNLRYFVLTVAYLALGLIFSCYWNYYYVITKCDSFLLQVYTFFTTIQISFNDYYMAFLLFNVISICCASLVFWWHIKNIFAGITSYECNKLCKAGNTNWKDNFVQVFGNKWYYALIWPLADSPLPKM